MLTKEEQIEFVEKFNMLTYTDLLPCKGEDSRTTVRGETFLFPVLRIEKFIPCSDIVEKLRNKPFSYPMIGTKRILSVNGDVVVREDIYYLRADNVLINRGRAGALEVPSPITSGILSTLPT